MSSDDLLVVTPSIRYTDLSKRKPLCRLSIPVERVPRSLRSQTGIVWWAERRGQKVWLRGYWRAENTTQEPIPEGFSRRLVWHPLPASAERLTWPGTFDAPEAEVSTLLARYSLLFSHESWAAEVPQSLGIELEQKRNSLGELTWSYDMARSLLHRSSLPFIGASQMKMFSGDIDRARAFARHYMARAELVRLPGQDPYEVTAAILAGYLQMPVANNANEASRPKCNSIDHFDFSPLKPDDVAIVGGDRSHPAPGSQDVTRERADRRHQEIVRSLSLMLMQKGYDPTRNQFVDLRIETGDRVIFFEIKTADDGNFSRQARLAVGQLLEYRFRAKKTNGDKPIQLVAVIEEIHDAAIMQFAEQFLNELGIELLTWKPSLRNIQRLAAIVN